MCDGIDFTLAAFLGDEVDNSEFNLRSNEPEARRSGAEQQLRLRLLLQSVLPDANFSWTEMEDM